MPSWRYTNSRQRADFYRTVIDRASALPGIKSAAFAGSLPLDYSRFGANVLGVDPVILALVSLLLALISLLSSYVPARRAAKVDPMVALRYE